MNEPQRRWTIVIDQRPQKEMRRLPSDLRQRIDRAILALAEDPRPAGCRPVKDAPRGTYRVRVGAYRVIYTVLDAEGVVVVARVRKREHLPRAVTPGPWGEDLYAAKGQCAP